VASLSLGLLLLDLPSLEVEWDSAEADANESTALENLKKLSSSRSVPPNVFSIARIDCQPGRREDGFR